MKPVIKKGRRFRGLEVAQAALLLVLGVVIALAMYYVAMNMFMSAPVPAVQLDTYRSFVGGNTSSVFLKFGKSGVVKLVRIYDGRANSPQYIIARCFESDSPDQGLRVVPGQLVRFNCKLDSGKYWTDVMAVVVRFWDDDVVTIRWVPN
jgi:hypothetical protein